jgi:hypothetical protein
MAINLLKRGDIMSQKKNFIKTTDKETAEKLMTANFQLVSQDNDIYTFLNKLPKNFNFDEVDKTKMIYTNILNV